MVARLPYWIGVQACGLWGWEIRPTLRVRRDADTMSVVVVSVPVLPRKASSECVHGPYRKPTQVVR